MCPVDASKSNRAGHARPEPHRCVSCRPPCAQWTLLIIASAALQFFSCGREVISKPSCNMFYSDATMFHQNACIFLLANHVLCGSLHAKTRRVESWNDTLYRHGWHRPNDRNVGSATSPELIHIGDVAENVSCPMVHCFATWTAPVARSVE